jgi:hypothetical protein
LWQGEQLKRESVVDLTDQSSHSTGSIKLVSSVFLLSNSLFYSVLRVYLIYVCSATEVTNRFKKQGLFRAPRYNDTRLDEVFAAKKPRFRIATGKENVKVSIYASFTYY